MQYWESSTPPPPTNDETKDASLLLLLLPLLPMSAQCRLIRTWTEIRRNANSKILIWQPHNKRSIYLSIYLLTTIRSTVFDAGAKQLRLRVKLIINISTKKLKIVKNRRTHVGEFVKTVIVCDGKVLPKSSVASIEWNTGVMADQLVWRWRHIWRTFFSFNVFWRYKKSYYVFNVFKFFFERLLHLCSTTTLLTGRRRRRCRRLGGGLVQWLAWLVASAKLMNVGPG